MMGRTETFHPVYPLPAIAAIIKKIGFDIFCFIISQQSQTISRMHVRSIKFGNVYYVNLYVNNWLRKLPVFVYIVQIIIVFNVL